MIEETAQAQISKAVSGAERQSLVVELDTKLPLEAMGAAKTKRERMALAAARNDELKSAVVKLIEPYGMEWKDMKGSAYGVISGKVDDLKELLSETGPLAKHPALRVLPNFKATLD